MEKSESAPAMVVTIAITIASLGRSTKMEESTAQLLTSGMGEARTGVPGLIPCNPSTMTRSPALSPRLDDGVRADFRAGLHAANGGFSILGNEDIESLLVGDKRGLRNYELLLRRFHAGGHPHKLAIDEGVIGIGDRGAHQNRVRRFVDRDIDEIDVPLVAVNGSIGEADTHLDLVPGCALIVLPDFKEFALADWEGDVHWVLADDHRQHAAIRRDDVPLRDFGAADFPCDWRLYLGVAEIDFGGVQVCLSNQDICGGVFIVGERLVALLWRAVGRSHHLDRAFEFGLSERL